jgi:hypothetical protein
LVRGSNKWIVARSIPSWEYLLGGLLFIIVGVTVFLGSAAFGTGSGTTFGVPIWFVLGPVGTLILAVGGYWLWKFDRVDQSESNLGSTRATAR